MCQKVQTCFKIVGNVIFVLSLLLLMAIAFVFYSKMIRYDKFGPVKPTSWLAKDCYGDVLHPMCFQAEWFPTLSLSIDIPVLTLVARDKQTPKTAHG